MALGCDYGFHLVPNTSYLAISKLSRIIAYADLIVLPMPVVEASTLQLDGG